MKTKLFIFLSFLIGTVQAFTPKKVVVIGATSDIGQELCKILLSKGHTVVAADDDKDQLVDMQTREGQKLKTTFLEIADSEKARAGFQQIIKDIDGLDICILCNSIAPEIDDYGLLKDRHIPWSTSRDTIDVNVKGTTALANVALNHFLVKKKGYLAGVSSLDALYGHPGCPCYTASKAFMSNYMEAMRQKCIRLGQKNIHVCDIRWSFVSQVKDSLGKGWTENPQEAALQMLKAIEERKPVAYIMSRWSFILWAITAVPSLVRNAVTGLGGLRYISKYQFRGDGFQ